MVEGSIMQLSLQGSPMTLVSSLINSKGNTESGGTK